MEKERRNEGFSLVELMLATIAFGILAVSVGTLLYFGWLGWRINKESVAMQRDASLAMRMMAKEIRNSMIDEIDTSSGIRFNAITDPPVRPAAITFAENGENLERNGSWAVINGWLVPGSFNATPQMDTYTIAGGRVITNWAVRIEFDLQSTGGKETSSHAVVVKTRN
jgi:prepilin-type N-terminal cleavage/methylation domain-containing protein